MRAAGIQAMSVIARSFTTSVRELMLYGPPRWLHPALALSRPASNLIEIRVPATSGFAAPFSVTSVDRNVRPSRSPDAPGPGPPGDAPRPHAANITRHNATPAIRNITTLPWTLPPARG